MASRQFFTYDPYEFAYDQYYNLYEPYYLRQSAPTRRARDIFAGAEPAAAKARSTPRATESETQTSFSIPVNGPDSPDRAPSLVVEARTGPMAPAMSAEDAAARMQAAARGFLARKSVLAVRQVDQEAAQVAGKMACEAETLLADPRARVAVWEALMRMLLRLDAVRGARDYRRRVTKRVVALQDAVDALVAKPAPATVEMAEEIAIAPELPDAEDEKEDEEAETHEAAAVEIAEESNTNVGVDEPEGSEILAEENEHTSPALTAVAGAASDVVDARKLMQMVATLCEQSAQQCALIEALAERVDMLERTLRRMQDADSAGGRPTS
ncbi:uncharacterized protein [Zea mays]|jgi:hypothetical protein|uniref:BAG domain containing protein expressed n=1 Tax=Zea mays TaxID=4577 RepID=A0A1D6F5P1_MAIZE|nr:uncharacterized protein LOC118476432 [Zea mays]ONM26605.1 BAG domain containing protein expressed [Zea mays]